MQKTVTVYGGISAVLTSGLMILSLVLMQKGIINFDNGAYFGYAGMIVALSMVFLGIKSYRDQHQNGAIKFWKGVQVGMLITVIASLAYAITWEIYYRNAPGVETDYLNNYAKHSIAKMKERGASQQEIDKATIQMDEMKEMYKNPFIRFGMTLTEILPVGIVIVLASAGILRRKGVLPA